MLGRHRPPQHSRGIGRDTRGATEQQGHNSTLLRSGQTDSCQQQLALVFSTSSDISSIQMYSKCTHGVKATLESMAPHGKCQKHDILYNALISVVWVLWKGIREMSSLFALFPVLLKSWAHRKDVPYSFLY